MSAVVEISTIRATKLPAKQRKRTAFIAGFIALLLLACLGWLAYSGIRQDRLDRALFLALEESNPSQVTSLLKQGANPNARDRRKEPPVTLISFYRTLIRPHRDAQPGEPALVLISMPKNEQASMKNGEDCLKALVAAGADVNVQDARGWTAMMYCVITMHDEITLYLLDHGANPNLANSEGNIALHLAAIDVDLQDPYILDELLAHGAIVDKLDVYGQSPLFYAAYSHKIEWVKGLIAHGANPNIRFWGKHGKTLLDYVNEDSTFLSEEDLKKKRGIIKALKLAGAK